MVNQAQRKSEGLPPGDHPPLNVLLKGLVLHPPKKLVLDPLNVLRGIGAHGSANHVVTGVLITITSASSVMDQSLITKYYISILF